MDTTPRPEPLCWVWPKPGGGQGATAEFRRALLVAGVTWWRRACVASSCHGPSELSAVSLEAGGSIPPLTASQPAIGEPI